MANFLESHKVVMVHEGGYANHPADKGGETYKGVARKFHPNWDGWSIVDKYKGLPNFENKLNEDRALQSKVLSFYKEVFWDALKLDLVENEAIALELYDTSVNMGQSIGAKFLQTALNVSNKNGKSYPDLTKDGKIGPKTIAALNKHENQKDLLKVLNVLQGARYIDIMERDPSQEVFFRSWFNRVSL
jgi:lysozyme family protein